MNKKPIKLSSMSSTDIYSLLLFAVYKLKDSPEYSTLSELVYLIDHDSLLRFLKYFGGTTITIPTIRELNLVSQCLLLYQKVNIEHETFDKAIDNLTISSDYHLTEIKHMYFTLCDVLENYSFTTKGDECGY